MESDIEAVFSNNSKQLKKLFECLHPKDTKISIQDFLIFCKNELVSISEIKKLIQIYGLKSGISLGNLQLIIRLLAEQAFNTTSSIADKLRMLIIHIRSPCKLFYQVSLNFNIKDSSSDELEVDQLEFLKGPDNKIQNSTQEISQKVIRNRYFSTSPDMVLLLNSEKSPKTQILDQKFTENRKIGPKNTKKNKKIEKKGKNQEIKLRLEKLKNTHQDIVQSDVSSNISKKLQMRKEYAYNLRNNLFSSIFVKKVIFSAWKAAYTKTL